MTAQQLVSIPLFLEIWMLYVFVEWENRIITSLKIHKIDYFGVGVRREGRCSGLQIYLIPVCPLPLP